MCKVKVCHVTTVHKQNDSRIFHKECKSLAKYGFETVLLVVNGETAMIDGVQVISVNFESNGRINRIMKSGKAICLKAIEVNADIYHLHDPELLLIASKLKKATNSKVVYDSHEDLPKQILDKKWIPIVFRKLLSRIVHWYEMKKVRQLDGVISVTEKICERFSQANEKVGFVANYPVLAEMSDLRKTNIEKKENVICYIGALFETRGIKELVQALEFCNATLYLAGNFSSKEFEKEVKSLEGWKRVKFFGYVNREEIVGILNSANVGIVTLHPTESYKESLPIKLFEYMSAKLPVIASNFEMWRPLVIGNNCGVMVDPMNLKEIGSQIDYFLENKDKAIEMGESGYRAVHEKYSWKSQEKKLIDFYQSL